MFFIRSFEVMYQFVNEAIATLTAYINGQVTALTTYVGEQLATRDKTVNRGSRNRTDYDKGALDIDNTYHDLSFANIVPAGTKFIQFEVLLQNNTLYEVVTFREKGYYYHYTVHKMYIQAEHIPISFRFWMGVNEDLLIEYHATLSVWSAIDITVVAWK